MNTLIISIDQQGLRHYLTIGNFSYQQLKNVAASTSTTTLLDADPTSIMPFELNSCHTKPLVLDAPMMTMAMISVLNLILMENNRSVLRRTIEVIW